MRLTAVLCYFKKRSHIPGHILRGKVRLYPYISDLMKRSALKDAMREKQNLEILANPYLKKEEEYYTTKDKRTEAFFKEREAIKDKRWLKHKYTADYFNHWKKFKTWE